MTPPLVSISDLRLFTPGDKTRKIVLTNLDWKIAQGGHCAVFGPNGSGKSMLLRLLHGRLWPASGTISWLGKTGLDPSPITGQAISSLVSPAMQEEFQRLAWQCSGRIFIERLYLNSTQTQPDLDDLAGLLKCADLLSRPVNELSQGELRILMLTGALIRKPKLLLLDESLEGLDQEHRKLFHMALKKYARFGTVVMTTHRPDEVPDWVKKYYRLESGSLTKQGIPKRNHPIHNILSPKSDPGAHESLIDVSNASVYIDRKKILKNIDWKMRPGEQWLISGDNGSGKSTFLRLLAGLENVAAGGSIRYSLEDGAHASLDQVRRRIILVSDLGQALYSYDLSVLDLLCSGFDNSIGIYRRFSMEEIARARNLLQKFFPAEFSDEFMSRPMRSLSSGQLRRLFLARGTIASPRILLLDEPLSGLDEQARDAYGKILEKMLHPGETGRPGMQVVFVSHNPGDAPGCINRWGRLENGRMIIANPSCPRSASFQ